MKKRIALLCAALFCLYLPTALAQVSVGDSGTLTGRVFTDYYWMAQNHDSDLEGKNGFWMRRIYLTYERSFSEAFSSRVRLEMNSAGDFSTSAEMIPNVKDAYLKWQNDRHQILAGISSTPTFGLTEDVWGYRSIEKSPQDLYDFGSSRDFGLSFKGSFDNDERLNYHFFVGNGNSNKPEVDKGKKVMVSLGYYLTEHLVIEGYADLNDQENQDIKTAQVFAGYQSETFNLGALYSFQHRESDIIGGDPTTELDLVSVFSNMRLHDSLKGFLRVDHMFDPYPGGSENSYIPFAENVESTFIVGGLDILLEEQIHLMPNIEAVTYGEDSTGERPDMDLIPRITLSYNF
ncbi:hypothetical protein [Fodinibius sediminis]|uniref:Porin n=1 Tax=Fodinibius sediminis TaxID=1214077 RepID=A0A521DBJ6_9BACT|nr:hypothetical protein [Fodinibius sediminis]SMO68985.1 hypothetical protein SAMN06265218_109128 [Fodinibius sediminis]